MAKRLPGNANFYCAINVSLVVGGKMLSTSKRAPIVTKTRGDAAAPEGREPLGFLMGDGGVRK